MVLKYLLNYYLQIFPVNTNATRFLPLGTMTIYGMNHQFMKCFLAQCKPLIARRAHQKRQEFFSKENINKKWSAINNILNMMQFVIFLDR